MGLKRMHIAQGEYAIGDDPDLVISTILGSCVSCCLCDPVARVGGMNHMLLTVNNDLEGARDLMGVNAMELLINGILKAGGNRDRLRAKVFGGARMVAGLTDIGHVNGAFTVGFLKREGIYCENHSLGGEFARHIRFWPATGKAQQKRQFNEEAQEVLPASQQRVGNGLELF